MGVKVKIVVKFAVCESLRQPHMANVTVNLTSTSHERGCCEDRVHDRDREDVGAMHRQVEVFS